MKRPRIAACSGYVALLLLVALYLIPIVFMFSGSLKPDNQVLSEAGTLSAFIPRSISLQNYIDVFIRVPFPQYMLNSLIIAGMIVICGLVVNSLAGYSLARLQWQGKHWLLYAIFAVMILPLEAIVVPLFYQITLLGWRDTYLAQIVPFVANAFSVYLFYTFFIAMPRELEEAAYVDGASTLRTFLLVIVPNSKPVFASVTILTFLTQWGAYLWPLMITQSEKVRPLPLAISTFYSLPPLQWGDIFAFGVMMITPILIVFVVFQSWFVKGVSASAIKG